MLVVVGIAFELGGSSELLISASFWDWSAAAAAVAGVTGLALVGDEDEWW